MTLETRPPQLTICVLGGTGFVGTELITHRAKDGHWIRVPTRSAADNDSLRVLDTVQLIGANVHDPRALARLFAGVDVVINLIGILNEHGRCTRERRSPHPSACSPSRYRLIPAKTADQNFSRLPSEFSSNHAGSFAGVTSIVEHRGRGLGCANQCLGSALADFNRNSDAIARALGSAM
jgi:hypothetical protein